MANPSWFIICGIAFTTLVVVDNVRLRMELADLTTVSTATQAAAKRGSAVRRSERRLRSPSPTTPQTAVEKQPATDISDVESEARIEREVAARVEQVVEARLDSELDEAVEERVEARMAERHQERRERFQQAMDDRVSEFIADRELSAETEAQMMTVMSGAMDQLGDMFRSMQEGEIERDAMREEMQAIRLDVDEALTELLGEEDAEAFQEDLRGPLGRRGWSR